MRYSFVFCLLFIFISGYGQGDMIVLKKRGKMIHSYFPGKEIFYQSDNGVHNAYINAIKDDSLFLAQFDIRQVMTFMGTYAIDTVATYRYSINYHDITAIVKPPKSNFSWHGIGSTLYYGGAVLTAAGLVTWALAKPNTRYYARPELVIGAAAATGIGYLLMHTKTRSMDIGKKYTLVYVELQ